MSLRSSGYRLGVSLMPRSPPERKARGGRLETCGGRGAEKELQVVDRRGSEVQQRFAMLYCPRDAAWP